MVLHPPYLAKTTRIALLVGAILILVNHYDEVWAGRAAPSTWAKAAVTCVDPFSVANWGVLTGRRRKEKS